MYLLRAQVWRKRLVLVFPFSILGSKSTMFSLVIGHSEDLSEIFPSSPTQDAANVLRFCW